MTEPRSNFDFIARPYRWLEYLTFGTKLKDCRNQYLPQLSACRRALVLGDGDGRFIAELLKINPSTQADAVDTSRAMLQLLRRRCEAIPGAAPRLRTYQASALEFPLNSYDLAVTHFFLDCFTKTELARLTEQVAKHLTPGALWVISDFRIPDGPMQYPAKLLVRLLYLAFRIMTNLRITHLPDYAPLLRRAGFVQIASRTRLAGILISELWQLQDACRPK